MDCKRTEPDRNLLDVDRKSGGSLENSAFGLLSAGY